MPQQSWTIGSDPSCDIVVESTTVSGQHCRLAREANKLTLTDLESTNGTFVNGQRLIGSRTIFITDRVTLGQTQSMPWPEGLKPADVARESNRPGSTLPAQSRQVITLGRGSDNTVVLNESNVSTQHARLTVDGGEVVLEDLGSTNGTSVGAVENKVSRAVVQVGDTIFLGSTAYQVSDLIARAQPTHIHAVDRRVSQKNSSQSRTKNPLQWVAIGGGVVLLLLLGGFVMRNQDRGEPSQTDISNSNLPPTPTQEDTVIDVPKHNIAGPPTLDALEVAAPAPTAEETIAGSLYVIVCTDAEKRTPFRIGTGFAVDPHHIATSAAVIEVMRGLQKSGFSESFLYSPKTDGELTVASIKTHPQYGIASTAARNAQQEHDAIFDELEAQPPLPEAFEAAKEKLLAARMKALQAIERKTFYDVAVIKVNEPLSHWVSTAGSDVSLRPNQKIHVTGYAFDVEDPYFDRAAPIELTTMSSRVGQLVKSFDDSARRILAKGAPEQRAYGYLGSPVMNAQGQVVAVYSRPTPAEDQRGELETEARFDAALWQRVRECLAEQR